MHPSQEQRRVIQRLRLQLELIDVGAELERIAGLYPDTKRAIDKACDLLGRYSHSISGLTGVTDFCGPENHTRMEVAA